jgi:DNA-binding Lrp family transcriptional regulator
MNKIDLEDAKVWVSGAVKQHSHDLIKALAHRYQVSNATASATIRKLEIAGLITRSGAVNRPVFESASNSVLMHSYSLPLQDEEQIWERDFAPFLLDGVTAQQRELIHTGFVAIANNASTWSRGKTLHAVVEQSLNNIELTLQDNGIGVFKHIAPAHPEMTTATELLNAQMTVHPNRSVTVLAGKFDYFQIEANGMHFPEELAPDLHEEELFEQGTTVIMGLTLNHDITQRK